MAKNENLEKSLSINSNNSVSDYKQSNHNEHQHNHTEKDCCGNCENGKLGTCKNITENNVIKNIENLINK